MKRKEIKCKRCDFVFGTKVDKLKIWYEGMSGH